MSNVWSVIRFTFKSRVRTPSFRIMTMVFIALITVLVNLPSVIAYFMNQSKAAEGEPAVGVFLSAGPAAHKLIESGFSSKQPQPLLRFVTLPEQGSAAANERMAKEKITAKEIQGYLELSEPKDSTFPDVIYKSPDSLTSNQEQFLQTLLRSIKIDMAVEGSDLTAEQKAEIQLPVRFESRQISLDAAGAGEKTEDELRVAYGLVYALLMFIYIGVIGYGNMVAMEITAEKSSRVMEVLIASVSPLKQMFGKIVGISLLGLMQVGILLVTAIVNLNLPHNAELLAAFNMNWTDIPLSLLVYFVFFYLGGFFLYATMFAAVGSLVSRTEDVGPAIMPVTYVIIAAFIVAMAGLQSPNAGYVAVMSFIPLFTPLLMFLRIGMSEPPLWQIVLSMAELVASIGLLGWLSAKIYRTGVLMYGKRPSLRELRRAMRAYK
ncbi:ABC transporter permease [Paenibacillus chartarius]|uniref:ABC transporter permease n=1 Tax=Paenibacillus chartarius TaxID=747481 RepID=A0ABV6DG90_9BACL